MHPVYEDSAIRNQHQTGHHKLAPADQQTCIIGIHHRPNINCQVYGIQT